MFHRLLPPSADNDYRGSRLALWLLGLIVLMKTAMSVNSIFNGRLVASSADGIPVDTFTPGGAQTVVALFAAWGVSHLAICLLCLVVLVRYRALVPLMLLVLLLEHLSRRLVPYFLPIPRTGTPPGPAINLLLLSLMIIGLALSLRRRPVPS